jgi:hypothetical protein
MSVVRYRADIDILTPGRNPGLPFELVERTIVLALCKLQAGALGRQGRIELTALGVDDFTLNDRLATRAEQHELYQSHPPAPPETAAG